MKSIEWRNGSVRWIDQSKLPLEEIFIQTDDYRILADAIRTLGIRGAPLIGIAAAYGVALAALKYSGNDFNAFTSEVQTSIDELSATRPTAVNLFWALQRMKNILASTTSIQTCKELLTNEAVSIHREDEEMCRKIGEHGAKLIPRQAAILTHCNTGVLATGGEGTAQSVITTAHRSGKSIKVFAGETRPLLQGARLTTWELMKAGLDVTLITDGMSAYLMKQKRITLVITGADRIAANGDSANKIGTYNLAVSAKHHGIPFYIAAPSSTIDTSIVSGEQIPVEERNAKEITEIFGKRLAPEGVNVYSPAFDITPANLITSIITEKGVYEPPYSFSSK